MMKKCNLEKGRSMIEMLGVLAIIGVLSVGGIAGYSKAMTKYRVNKTIEQITLITGNVRTFFTPQGNYNDVGNNNTFGNIARKAKLIPEEMWKSDAGFTSVFGTDVTLNKDCSGLSSIEGFSINYILGNDVDACIEIITHDWKSIGIDAIINQMDGYALYTNISIDKAVNLVDQMCNNHTTNFCFNAKNGF